MAEEIMQCPTCGGAVMARDLYCNACGHTPGIDRGGWKRHR
ncbi:hypothetical protein LCGC14_1829100 [marine sediment metagenome]|uniref:Uncharacterized protein n=1 Tax=marine sediment metagenome TaxID=412755 RepID=A0A0F9JG56_9ZZZZ